MPWQAGGKLVGAQLLHSARGAFVLSVSVRWLCCGVSISRLISLFSSHGGRVALQPRDADDNFSAFFEHILSERSDVSTRSRAMNSRPGVAIVLSSEATRGSRAAVART